MENNNLFSTEEIEIKAKEIALTLQNVKMTQAKLILSLVDHILMENCFVNVEPLEVNEQVLKHRLANVTQEYNNSIS